MSPEYRKKVIAYRITMCVFKGLVLDGTITEEDYRKIDTIMTKKYGLYSSTLFSE